jgi:hypothetical protein
MTSSKNKPGKLGTRPASKPRNKAHRVAKSAADAKMLIQRGFEFKKGRNCDRSGWDTDGGYALSHSWI